MATASSTLLRMLRSPAPVIPYRTPPTAIIPLRRALPIAGASAAATGGALAAGKGIADQLTAEPVPR